MIHVWLATHKGAFRVWNTDSKRWVTASNWQEVSIVAAQNSSTPRNKRIEVCLYFPSQMALTLTNELELSQIKQLGTSGQQYLFEDLTLSPVDSLCVRHLNNGQKQHFYALGASQIEQWQQSAKLANIEITVLLPDFVLLPIAQQAANTNSLNEVFIYQDISTILLRYASGNGQAISFVNLLPKLLTNLDKVNYISNTARHQNIEELDASNLNSTQDDEDIRQIQAICDEQGVVFTTVTNPITPIDNPNKHALNFIEKVRSHIASPYLMIAASVLVLAGVLQISADALKWYKYQQATLTTKTAINEQFTSWFDGEKLNPRVDVGLQVKPRLNKGYAVEQVQINTLNRVSPILKQSNLVAKTLKWGDNDVSIVVLGTRREDIDTMQRALSEQGITANLGVIKPTDDGGVMGEVNLPFKNPNSGSGVDNKNDLS